MTEREATEITESIRALWPSKFYWSAEIAGLWIEKLTRPEWTARQVEAVIRDERAHDDGSKPKMAVILDRCHKAHQPARSGPIKNASEHTDLTPEKWAEIYRDRESAAAWWFENKGDRAEIVRKAKAAYPMWAGFDRFLDEKFKPTPVQCMALFCAWQEFENNGPRPAPRFAPGVMSGRVKSL